MSKYLTEQKDGELIGKWFAYKHMGYSLLLIKANKKQDYVRINYFFEKDENIDLIDIEVPENCTLPSITIAYPEGAQMQKEIADCYPIKFNVQEQDQFEENEDYAAVEWGPFHPLLPEPVLFRFTTNDEIINQIHVEAGYNYRGVEKLCIGKRVPEVSDMLERISSISGFSVGLTFLHAIEEISNVAVPDRAQFIRLIFNELSFLRANIHSLSQLSKCLGLLSDYSDMFRIIKLYNEALNYVAKQPQLKDILVIGGVKENISIESMFQLNVVIQEMVQELSDIKDTWKNTRSIVNRLGNIGKVDMSKASSMTGRIARAAGVDEDIRKLSKLPYSKLCYEISRKEESNCLSRAMLMFEDCLLSLSLIEQAIENLPSGDVKAVVNTNGSGRVLVREKEAYGELVMYVALDDGIVTELKIRNSSSLKFPFLNEYLKGIQINDMPIIFSSFELDLSGMEK